MYDRSTANESLYLLKREISNPGPLYQFLMTQFGWRHLSEWSANHLHTETQELLNSILIELYPELVDELETETGADENMPLVPGMTFNELEEIIETNYHWAFTFDSKDKNSNARFWYASENKEEPRFGWRYCEPGAEKEMRIGIAKAIQTLKHALAEKGQEHIKAKRCRVSDLEAGVQRNNTTNSEPQRPPIRRD